MVCSKIHSCRCSLILLQTRNSILILVCRLLRKVFARVLSTSETRHPRIPAFSSTPAVLETSLTNEVHVILVGWTRRPEVCNVPRATCLVPQKRCATAPDSGPAPVQCSRQSATWDESAGRRQS